MKHTLDLELLHLYRRPATSARNPVMAEFKRARRLGLTVRELRLRRLLAEAEPQREAS